MSPRHSSLDQRPIQPPAGQILDAQLHLLDRQVLDNDDVPVVVVADFEIGGVELDEPIDTDAPAPTITNLLSGPVILTRIFGGGPPASRLERTPWSLVSEVGTALKLGADGLTLPVSWTARMSPTLAGFRSR